LSAAAAADTMVIPSLCYRYEIIKVP